MPNPRIAIKLVGSDDDDGLVHLSDFRDLCDALTSCLHRIERVVAPGEPRPRYRIVGLEVASASLVVEASPPLKGRNLGSEIFKALRETVRAAERGERFDHRFQMDDWAAFRSLGKTISKRSKELWIGGELVTSQYLANIDRHLGQTIRTVGSLTGDLDALNFHNKNEFSIYLVGGQIRVTCSFPEGMAEQVTSAVKRRVTVKGTVYSAAESAFPVRIHANEIEIHPIAEKLPKLSEMRGIAPNITGDQNVVDFIRALRDE